MLAPVVCGTELELVHYSLTLLSSYEKRKGGESKEKQISLEERLPDSHLRPSFHLALLAQREGIVCLQLSPKNAGGVRESPETLTGRLEAILLLTL